MLAGFELLDREAPPTLPIGPAHRNRRGRDRLLRAARRWRQAARCLVCHVQTIYDPETCVLCSRCVDVCPEYCLAIVPFEELDLAAERRRRSGACRGGRALPLSAMIKDDDRCIRCGLCAIRCPTDAMTMEKFQITERYVRVNDRTVATSSCAGDRRRRRWPRHPGRGLAPLPGPQRLLRRAHHGEARPAPGVPRRAEVPARPSGSSSSAQGNIFHAISAVCTHLGCTVRAEALPQPEDATVAGAALAAHASLPLPLPRLEVRRRRRQRVGPAPTTPRLVPPRGRRRTTASSWWTSAREVGRDFRLTVAEEAGMSTDSPRPARHPASTRSPSGASRPRSDRESGDAVVSQLPAALVPGQGLQGLARLDATRSGSGPLRRPCSCSSSSPALPLLFLYVPSVERAYASVKDIEYVVTFGSWIRSVHRLSAHLMVAAVFLHLVRVFLTGAYKNGDRPRTAPRVELGDRRRDAPRHALPVLHGVPAAVGPARLLGRHRRARTSRPPSHAWAPRSASS